MSGAITAVNDFGANVERFNDYVAELSGPSEYDYAFFRTRLIYQEYYLLDLDNALVYCIIEPDDLDDITTGQWVISCPAIFSQVLRFSTTTMVSLGQSSLFSMVTTCLLQVLSILFTITTRKKSISAKLCLTRQSWTGEINPQHKIDCSKRSILWNPSHAPPDIRYVLTQLKEVFAVYIIIGFIRSSLLYTFVLSLIRGELSAECAVIYATLIFMNFLLSKINKDGLTLDTLLSEALKHDILLPLLGIRSLVLILLGKYLDSPHEPHASLFMAQGMMEGAFGTLLAVYIVVTIMQAL